MAMAQMTSVVREERQGGAEGTSLRRSFRHVGVLGLLIAAAAAGWFTADRILTEVSVPAAETHVEPAQSPALPPDFLISTDHGPMPTLPSGETVVVQVETSADKFVYCYYMDGSRQVARIFPNRFQSDAFVPAGKMVQISAGSGTGTPLQHPAGNGGAAGSRHLSGILGRSGQKPDRRHGR